MLFIFAVFFRKHTSDTAASLGLRGWVKNTDRGTVIGELEGPPAKVAVTKEWLTTTGSPKSVIEGAVFTEERSIQQFSFPGFDFRR